MRSLPSSYAMYCHYDLFTELLSRGVLGSSSSSFDTDVPKIRYLSDTLRYLMGVGYSRSMGNVAEGEWQKMYRRLVRQALLRLGLLVTLVVLAVSACGGEEQQQEAKARPLPEDRKALRPGEYRSEEFIPSLSFRVGEGWTNAPPEVFDALLITRGETAGLGFVSAQEVYETTRSG